MVVKLLTSSIAARAGIEDAASMSISAMLPIVFLKAVIYVAINAQRF